ncbi:MAG: hypothetical protein ACI3XE_00190 [Eubacteriales bacterium]
MKKLLTFVTLLLVLVLLATAFVGCDKDDIEGLLPGDTTGDQTNDGNGGNSGDNTTGEQKDGLQSARDYIFAMYKDGAEETPADYRVVGMTMVDGVAYTVTWTVDVTEDLVRIVPDEDGKMVTIDVVEEATADVPYTLTATIADAAGNTETVSFTRKVPKFAVMTWAQYIAAAKDDTVIVEGTVNGIISKSANGASSNGIYFQDNDGGYYAYGVTDDPATSGIEIGMKIRVSGTKDIYNGTHEIKSPVVTVIDSTKNPVTPADYTEIFANATALTDEALVAKQAFLVTIKDVLVTSQDTSSGYYKFQLGDKESYVRISGSACPLTTEEKTTFVADHAAKFGYIADVTGIITVYNGSFYLTPVTVDAFTYKGLPEKTPAEKVAFELDNLTLVEKIDKPSEITLPTAGATYTDVAFSWALAANDYATYDATTGKLTVTTVPSLETTITLTLTATCGEDATDTKEITITLFAATTFVTQALDAADALDSGKSTTNEWIVVGIVTDFEYSTQYSNATFYLSDGVNKIMVYRAAWDGLADVQNGDLLAVKGQLKKHNTTLEVVNASVYANLTSIADAAAAGLAGTGVADTVIYGQITAINTAYSASYNNITVTISDGTNTIQCYRLAGGEDLKVGDFIIVTGTPSAYSGKAQMAAGATYVVNGEIVPAEEPPVDEDTRDVYNAATNNTVTYSFADTVTKTGATALTDSDAALALFGASCNLKNGPLTAVSLTKVYEGTGAGGAHPNTAGILKVGTGSAGAQFVLTFDRNVASVQIKVHDFYASSDTYPTNTTNIVVNGSDAQTVPYNADGTPDVLTFDLTEASKTVTIDCSARMYIYEIIIVFETPSAE